MIDFGTVLVAWGGSAIAGLVTTWLLEKRIRSYEIRLGAIQAKRTEVLIALAEKLERAFFDTGRFLAVVADVEPPSELGTPTELEEQAFASVADFYDYLRKHRLYLSRGLEDTLSAFHSDLLTPFFAQFVAEEETSVTSATPEQRAAIFEEWKVQEPGLRKLQRSIEASCRALIGSDL